MSEITEEVTEEVTEEEAIEVVKVGIVDKFVEKAISRKFLAWLTATGLLAFGASITSSDWVTITAIFIGSQAAVDAIAKLRSI